MSGYSDRPPASGQQPLSGGLIVDKPEGWTSHDVVGRVRRLAATRRVGHTGTLDPFATGVLVVCVGRATRLAQLLSGSEKEYLAMMRLGWSTDTQDRTGEPLGPPPAPERIPDDPETLRAVLDEFQGEIDQVPPMYSAKKVGGTALYKLARRGEEVERKPVRVRVRVELDGPLVRGGDGTVDVPLRVVCSAGTYVRTLAHDIGARLGCGAHLQELRRTRAGAFTIEQASTLEALEGHVAERLVSPNDLASMLPAIELSEREVERVGHGMAVRLDGRVEAVEDADCRLVTPSGDLLAIARVDASAGFARPRIVLG